MENWRKLSQNYHVIHLLKKAFEKLLKIIAKIITLPGAIVIYAIKSGMGQVKWNSVCGALFKQ